MSKELISMFKNMQAFSFIIGIIFGSFVGLALFLYLVPAGPKAIAMLRHYRAHMSDKQQRNNAAIAMLYASSTTGQPTDHRHMMMTGKGNPYMMSPVISEKQFLNDMILHHEAALVMANQVLAISTISPEVKQLANDILKTQKREIIDMKVWKNRLGN